jgi:hypothetical protein
VREQVEVLEHHADVDAALEDLFLVQLVQRVAVAPVADELAVDGDEAVVDALQVVDGRSSVDLPEPDCPRITVTLPCGTVSVTSSSTFSAPKLLDTPWM